VTPQEITEQAFDDPESIPAGLEELRRQAADADENSQEYVQILDASRTLRRLKG